MVQKRKIRRDDPETATPKLQPPAKVPRPCEQVLTPNPEHDDDPTRNDPDDSDPDDSDLDDSDLDDDDQFDPNAVDVLGDFGLDDDEAIPDHNDFWFDDFDSSFD